MNKGHIFDDITRITARAGVDISRRKALSWMVGTLAYGTLGGIGLSRKALAAYGGGVCSIWSNDTCIDTYNLLLCQQLGAAVAPPDFLGANWNLIPGVACCNPSSSASWYTPAQQPGKCTYYNSYIFGIGIGTKNVRINSDGSSFCTDCLSGSWQACGVSGSFGGGTISFSSNCGFSNVTASGTNCTWTISGYNCTTGSVTVTATKTDTTKSASIYATAADCTGSSAGVDPVMTTLSLTTGRWVRQTFTDIPKAESYISVTNSNPGLRILDIRVNSYYHKILKLRANGTKTINVAEAMTTGSHNTVSLMGQGNLGASADVTISDTPPPSQPNLGASADVTILDTPPPSQANTKISLNKKLSHRDNNIWGHIAEEIHETSDLHNADASTQTVLIHFKGDLDSFSAGNAGLYSVDVNGRPVVVETANAQPQADGVELLLQLPPKTFKRGNTVDVYWEYLQDKKGRPLEGHVSLIAQRLK